MKRKPYGYAWIELTAGISIVIFCVVVLIVDRNPRRWISLVALVVALCITIVAKRFFDRSRKIGTPIGVLFLGGFWALLWWKNIVDTAAGIWLLGFLAGIFIGGGWLGIHTRRHPGPDYPWMVDDAGFWVESKASDAAYAGLKGLDGGSRKAAHAFLAVSHGDARFEVAGDASGALVCHYNPDAGDEPGWRVLVNPGVAESGDRVDVPMGRLVPSLPAYLVNDVVHVRSALEVFLGGDPLSAGGLEWRSGGEAEATRLSPR